jgi:hypothetical protein
LQSISLKISTLVFLFLSVHFLFLFLKPCEIHRVDALIKWNSIRSSVQVYSTWTLTLLTTEILCLASLNLRKYHILGIEGKCFI